MSYSRTVMFTIAAAWFLASTVAQARVSHGYSGVLALDTVTAVSDDADASPKATILASVYPNPFNPRTTIEFELAVAGPTHLAIYDVNGRLVRVIDATSRSAGRYRATWDGLDGGGHAVSTGTYFCRLCTTQGALTKKLTLAR